MFFKITDGKKIEEVSREKFLEVVNDEYTYNYSVATGLAGGYVSARTRRWTNTNIIYIDTNNSELEDEKVKATLEYLRRCG